ncbi:M16 family metallopeptidase [Sphingomonas alpina]|uniref:Insulinase family protein n=2 Tax=Sphingomonas alpina TaxID=653931 RepID=A0A7H0LFS3_9SPHN|nr:pitrilysin family protein [Sphingomonas alpina]QNQ08526.1 insulinase family protein [Sphingomonas alpina]
MKSFAAVTIAALCASTAVTATPAPRAPVAAAPIVVPPLVYTKRMLKNGMTIYAMRDPKAASVSLYMWYKVGQRDDPKERAGFAHLFEHLMFKPTRNLPQGAFTYMSTIVENANATTLFDDTLYTTTAPANRLETLLWLEGERLKNLVVDQANFESERNVVKEELRQRIFATPYGRILFKLIPGFVFSTHPYARPIGGTAEDLDKATLADVRAFHEAFYRPDNAVMVIAGNFDPKQLDAWADRYIGSIPKPAAPLLQIPASREPERTSPRLVDAYAPNVPLPALVAAWIAPPEANLDSAGIDVIEALLTRGAASRLNRSLVADKQLASSIATYNFDTRDGHAFAIVATLAKGADMATTRTALDAEIARLRDTPVDPAELASIKNALLGAALSDRETMAGRVGLIGDGDVLAGDPGHDDKRLAAISAMTPADVQRIAARWLGAQRQVTIRYQDESRRPAGYTGDVSTNDVASMGPIVPPATRPPVTIAAASEREQPPAPGPQRRIVPPIVEAKLANGLTIVSAQSTELPLVTLELVIAGGDAADPAGHAGLADLTAALALRGAASRDAVALAAAVDTLGGRISAAAQADATIVKITVPAANVDAAAALLGDVALRPSAAEDELDRERRKLADALAVSEKQPVQLALRALPAALFAGTPYGAVATPGSLAAIDAGDVAAARAKWGPRGATLVVTGSLDAKQVATLAERTFGSWRGGAPAPAFIATAKPHRIIAIDLPGAPQTAVIAAVPTGARSAGDQRALQVANAIVGGGAIGWLSKEIREKRGLSYGAGSQIDMRRGAGFVMAASQTKTASAPEVVDLMLAQFARLPINPPSAAEDAERSEFVSRILASQTDRTIGLGDYLAGLVATGTPLSVARTELSPGTAVTPAEVAAAAKRIDPKTATVLVVGDSKAWLPALRAAHPNVELVDAAALIGK